MTLSRLFFRFLIYYLGLMFLTALAVSFLGVQSKSGINMGILVGLVVWVCLVYTKKNNRRIVGREKLKVVCVLASANFFVQLLGLLAVIDKTVLFSKPEVLVVPIGLAVFIQTVAIYFFVGLSQLLYKQLGGSVT